MTPAEFFVVLEGKIEQRNEEWRFRDILNGVRCSLLANINRSKGARAYTVEDFRIMKEEKRQTPEQIMAMFDHMAGEDNAR